jgi:serine/threonine protein kinase
VDAVCVRFEAACKAADAGGPSPRPEDYLGDTPEPARSALLRELLALELAYRWRSTDRPTVAEYQVRCRGAEEVLRPAWGQAAPAPVGGPVTPPADYELLELLGQGGMGVVYRARQRSARRVVALKFLRTDRLNELAPERRREWLERFRTEAQATARLEHEHIVTVYEVGTSGEVPFYSMRYVRGRSLEDLLCRGPLAAGRAAALLEAVARAVQFAHAHGILHRDLTPRNVLVDGDDRPYVADFGLAKWLEAAPNLTRPGDWLGTPSYMSPEQAENAARVTPASDVYSLGATLYALLTGRPPFGAAGALETLLQVKYCEPVAPRRLNPAVPPELEAIALTCLHKDPGRRFGTAAELANELQRYRNRRPPPARAAGACGRGWRWARRRPLAALLLASAVAAMAGLAAGLSYQALTAEPTARANPEELWREPVPDLAPPAD